MKCRYCLSDVTLEFIDLGTSPPSNAYLSESALSSPEKWYPLRVFTCTTCWLVQTQDFTDRTELFSPDYAYFSSVSSSWLRHCRDYSEQVTKRFSLDSDSLVVELASNDGYLLQYFKQRAVPCFGVEPTQSTAEASRDRGLEVIEDFFGLALAKQLAARNRTADLVIANNVLAHVPDMRDFVSGIRTLLKPTGVATFEFPHLLRLIAGCQFDTIYHEHFSYLSLTVVSRIFADCGLSIFDVEELSTHGGSLRIFAQRNDSVEQATSPQVRQLLDQECAVGVKTENYYRGFGRRVQTIKNDLLDFLIASYRKGAAVAAYGAAAKGNTLLNYSGIRSDLVSFVVDKNPAKQLMYLPGSRIPVVDEARLRLARPTFVLLLPWNLRQEIILQLEYIKDWGGKLVVAVPQLEIL